VIGRRGIASVLAGAALCVCATPADADDWSTAEDTGDAPEAIDLNALNAVNGRRAVRVRAWVNAMERDELRDTYLVIDTGRTFGEGYLVVFGRSRRGADFRARFYRAPFTDANPTELDCEHLSGRLGESGGAHYVRLRLPQRCLGDDAGRVRLGVRTFGFDGQTDSIPDVDMSGGLGPWVARG
jgi:hypothetical protein